MSFSRFKQFVQRHPVASLLLFGFVLLIGSNVFSPSLEAGVGIRKIVVFQPGVTSEAKKEEVLSRVAGEKIKPLKMINAWAVRLPTHKAATNLKRRFEVLRVDDDVVLTALPGKGQGNGGGASRSSAPASAGSSRSSSGSSSSNSGASSSSGGAGVSASAPGASISSGARSGSGSEQKGFSQNDNSASQPAELLDPSKEKEEDPVDPQNPGKGKGPGSKPDKGGPKKEKEAPAQPSQILPWGVDRIEAERVWASHTGNGVNVAIIDTGIELDHPDLQANVKGGFNAISMGKSANDDNGHGTHVAGTVAAVNDTIGVVGVAPTVNLYAVKVLDRNGSGYLSDVIEGIQWAMTNNMQVANLSLGTTSNVYSFQEAIQKAVNAGLTIVAAAGNDGGSVNYPAAYNEVIAVSALDKSDRITSWSSRGSQVDLAAPGLDIESTYKGKTYAKLSGTSMATPHVTGTAALVVSTSVTNWDNNGNGKWDPAEVQAKLEATAQGLGLSGKDNLYGSGRVDAERAVFQP